jgi:hypothetical protein
MMNNAFEICSSDLFTDVERLNQAYPTYMVEKVLRVRQMYLWLIANPSAKDAKFVEEDVDRNNVTRMTAYDDLWIVKKLLPKLNEASKEFHRWRFVEMILESYKMARDRKDTRTMEKAASSYAKYTGIDKEEEKTLPLSLILVQPFTATSDPSGLGIKPIPNLQEKIDSLLQKYRKETIDIDDIDFEEADLEENILFLNDQSDDGTEKESGVLQ